MNTNENRTTEPPGSNSSCSNSPSSEPVHQARHHDSPDERVYDNSAPVQIMRFMLPKDARELIIAVVLAASILTNWLLWTKLHDADKDLQTQVWLRDDALTKFEQGPFADLKAHVLALEMICRKER